MSATDRLVEALTADPGQGRGTATALTLGVGNAGQIDVTQRVMKCPHVISICGHLIQRYGEAIQGSERERSASVAR